MPQEEVGRRALLVGAGCGILALLGACSSQGPSGTTTTQTTARTTPPTTAGPSKTETLPSGTLAKVADVPVGGGMVSADNVLVLQLSAGKFTAYDAACPHQQFTVRPPDASGVITCEGHNSHFRAVDGSVIDGPAFRGLTPIAVKVSGDEVVRA